MNRAEQAALAWALVEAAKPIIRGKKRIWLHAAIGAGDHEQAIQELLTAFSCEGLPMREELVERVGTWAAGYSGSTLETRISELMATIPVAHSTDEQPAPHFVTFG